MSSRFMCDYLDYIKHETLSDEVKQGVPEEGAHAESYKINGYEMKLGV